MIKVGRTSPPGPNHSAASGPTAIDFCIQWASTGEVSPLKPAICVSAVFTLITAPDQAT